MTPTAAAEATRDAVVAMPSHFMLDAATYAHGAELGFEGANYYVAGRGAVLGPCDADVVAAAFVFFNPGHIRAAWDASVDVMSSEKAAIGYGHVADKFAQGGFTPIPSETIAPPRIVECPLQFEAELIEANAATSTAKGGLSAFFIVETRVKRVHAHRDIVLPGTNHVDTGAWKPLLYVFRHYFGTGADLGRTFKAEY